MSQKETLERILKTNKMLEEFFELNEIPEEIVMQSLLSLYFTLCTEMDVPASMIDLIFDEAKDKYRQIQGMRK